MCLLAISGSFLTDLHIRDSTIPSIARRIIVKNNPLLTRFQIYNEIVYTVGYNESWISDVIFRIALRIDTPRAWSIFNVEI